MLDHCINDTLRLQYNPDGSSLRDYQLHLVGMLYDFDNICNQIGVNYWLSQGTALGAIRHGGFIPWDDDIDVEMTYSDFMKFRKKFVETERYALQNIHTDPMYPLPFAKFRDKKTTIYGKGHGVSSYYKYQGPFIDIFYTEYSFKGVSKFINYFFVISASCVARFGDKKIAYPFIFLFKHFGEVLSNMARVLLKPFPGQKYGLGYGSHFYDVKSDIRDIFPLKRHIFETHTFPVPNNCDGYLRTIYGDYMRIPKDIERKTHLD